MSELTKRQRQILTLMAKHRDCPEECENHEDGEIVYEHGYGWLGSEHLAPRTIFALIRLNAIAPNSDPHELGVGVERYEISETGERLLAAEQ